MKVKVTRIVMAKWREALAELGSNAVHIEVPGTNEGCKFKGFFKDHLKQEILVAWPVNRPQEAQEEFVKNVCLGSWPVEEMERKPKATELSLVKD